MMDIRVPGGPSSPTGPCTSTTSAIGRTTPTKAQEQRRITKPIMEKRRRARINQCLNELKDLILEALNKDPSRHTKLEKADILEMTVRHLQNIHRRPNNSNNNNNNAVSVNDPQVISKFRDGFAECANEVNRFVSRNAGLEASTRQRLLNHLHACINSFNTLPTSPSPLSPTSPGPDPSLYSPIPSQSQASPNGIAFPGMLPPPLNLLQDHNNNSPSSPSPSSTDDGPVDYSKLSHATANIRLSSSGDYTSVIQSPLTPGITSPFPPPSAGPYSFKRSPSPISSPESDCEDLRVNRYQRYHFDFNQPLNCSQRRSTSQDEDDENVWRPW